ncbi:MAG: hypothetical protein ACYTFI_14880 [Planctomycetota bacterium]|jgi:hypothetical protein
MSTDFLPFKGSAPGHRQRSPSASRTARGRPRLFRYPLGVEMIEGENYRQREGYDVIYLKDEDPPRYQYAIAVSAEVAGETFRRLAEVLPEQVCVVLEIPSAEDSSGQQCDVWTSPPVERDLFLREFDAHERLFVHDGLVGYGAVASDGMSELFLDEHKLIYLYVPDMEKADAALAAVGIRALDVLRHFSELGHVHVSLSGKGAGEPYWEVADALKRALGLQWEESKEYT